MRFNKWIWSLVLLGSQGMAFAQQDAPAPASNPLLQLNQALKGAVDTINAAAASAQGRKHSTQPASGSSADDRHPEGGNATAPAAVSPNLPRLIKTPLAGLFAKHPYDGTAKSSFPRVAVTVIDWTRADCWQAIATLWWTSAKRENIPPFLVCWNNSLGFATNNAVYYQLFMRQMAVVDSGNVRSAGPKPPMTAFPMRTALSYDKNQQAITFIQQLLADTGWEAGGQTNIWIVDFDSTKGKSKPQG